MIRVLIDSNLIVELFVNRIPYIEDAEKLLQMLPSESLKIYCSDKGINDLYFYLSKQSELLAKSTIKYIKDFFKNSIRIIDFNTTMKARYSSISNYNHAVEITCATGLGLDALITLTPEIYDQDKLPILTVDQLLDRYQLEKIFDSYDTQKSLLINCKNERIKNYNLRGKDFSGQVFRGINLSGADLREANLSYIDLSYADLRRTKLSYANLSHANLNYANLSLADMNSSWLVHSNLRKTCLNEADLTNSQCFNATFNDANLTNVNLTNANLTNANLCGSKLTHSILKDTILTNVDFTNINLHKVFLITQELRGAKFGNNLGICQRKRWEIIKDGGCFSR